MRRFAFRKSYATPGSHQSASRPRCDCSNRNRRTRRHPERRPGPGPALPRRGRAWFREDHAGHAISHRGGQARRTGPVHHPLGDGRRTDFGRHVARLGPDRHLDPRAAAARRRARIRRAVHDVSPLRGGARGDHQVDPRGRAAAEADAGGVRLVVGTAAGRRQPAALSPSDPRAQAVFRRPAVHGDPPRRHDGGRSRPARAEHRARRDPPAAPEPRIRRRAPAAACRQVPWQRSTAAAFTTT